MKTIWIISFCILSGILFLNGCCKEMPTSSGPDPDLIAIAYQPTPRSITVPAGFPKMEIPADNPLTEEGITLGRFLFYDPILSLDSTIACASCHQLSGALTDNKAVSPGVGGTLGTRSSMSLINVAFNYNGLFWDGRSPNLEDQALHPIENPVEMKESWPKVLEKFRRHPKYPALFRKAFGIQKRSEITKELAAKALAQFQRLIISGNSRYDQVFVQLQDFPSDEEARGHDMFFDLAEPNAECHHCHNAPLFSTNEYFNNGIYSVINLNAFNDKGRGTVTGKLLDNGRFRATTLRNIQFSAPYMHDGRFTTLDEVLDHYDTGGRKADNLDPNLHIIHFTPADKQAMKAFLAMLIDTSYLSNPELKNPF